MKIVLIKYIIGFGIILLAISCKKEALPKPAGFLRLAYKPQQYKLTSTKAYEFETPLNAKILVNNKYWMKIKYPKINATIDITYRPVKNNLNELLLETEKLTTKHSIKADAIYFDTYEDKKNHIYGKLSNVTGDAASPLQFHITDSITHFITGAVYFDIQPNYDSIYPAIKHIEKDLKHLMSTAKWH